MNIQTISYSQSLQLANVVPSQDGALKYYPCCVELTNGSKFDNVYMIAINDYLNTWGVMPDDDKGKIYIVIEDVKTIDDSPNRLPADLANKIYNAGESGMGYCLFKILFDNKYTVDVLSGNAVDFVPIPLGLTRKNIKDVLPHQGSRSQHLNGLDYYWCIYKL